MKLLYTDTLEEARIKLNKQTSDWTFRQCSVPLLDALCRICAQDIIAAENVPSFRRSAMDGYALIASDTFGSDSSNPTFFDVIGHIPIEASSEYALAPGEAVQVQTGSMIPDNATAVLMAEYSETYGNHKLLCYKPVNDGEHVIQVGEDIRKTECILRKGQKICARHIGTLASLGISEVSVYTMPDIAIISTGDELVDLTQKRLASQIYDVNSYALAAIAKEYGLHVTQRLCIKDDKELLYQAVAQASAVNDIVILSGGSSKGSKDFTEEILAELTGNVFTHGIAVKPGKPTILAFDKNRQTIMAGLPGHPLAAVLIFKLIIGNWLYERLNLSGKQRCTAVLCENIPSNHGRESCQLIKLIDTDDGLSALPLYTKSGNISYLSRADGYVMIPRNREGLNKGEKVTVEVF